MKDDKLNISELSEKTDKQKEAEAKVAAMFASASAGKKQPKKKHIMLSSKDVVPSVKLPETKKSKENGFAEILNRAAVKENIEKKDDDSTENPVSAEPKNKQEEAEEKVAAMFADAAAQNPHGKSKGGRLPDLGTEIVILEFISIIMFFTGQKYDETGVISLFAVLMPTFVGIGYRILFRQLTLQESFSKCKLHIFITCFFFICIMMSV